MNTATIRLSGTVRNVLRRAAVFAALTTAGVFGAQAAELDTISLSEDVCLSCAYENGLPRSAVEIPAPRVAGADADESVATAATPSGDKGSAFGSASSNRPRLILPVSDTRRTEKPGWSTSEKALMWSFVSLSTIDAYQTMNAPSHVVEANPLLGSWAGDHPSVLETVLFKGATTYAMVKLAGRVKKRSTRRLALALMNFVQLSVAAHNEEVTGGIVF